LQELKYSNILLNSQYEIVRYPGYAYTFNNKSASKSYCILAEREIDINQEGIKKRFLIKTESMNSLAKEAPMISLRLKEPERMLESIVNLLDVNR